MGWRYILQALPSREWLHWDLPLKDVRVTPALSGAGGLTGTLPVATRSLLDDHGKPLVKQWRTAIWAEADGEIRGGGVVTNLRADSNGALNIECLGISGALVAGQPYDGPPLHLLQVDPLDVVRTLYRHVQSRPGADLGVVVDDTTSPVRVGIPEDPRRRAARLASEAATDRRDIAKATYDRAKAHAETTRHAALRAAGLSDMTGRLVVEELDEDGKEPSKSKKNLWYRPSKNRVHKVVERTEGKTKKQEWEAVPAALAATRPAAAAQEAEKRAKDAYDAAREAADVARRGYDDVKDLQEEEPFTLNYWSTHDIGRVIDDLAATTPFDIVEHTAWAPGSDRRLTHHLELAYPRRGRRRTDLRFVIGENVVVPPQPTWGEGYASDVMVLGAGEGSKMVTATHSARRDGIRRVAVHTDKSITTSARAAQEARRVGAELTGGITISSLTLIDHPHARLGTLTVGDEIRLLGSLPWTRIDLWLRVTAITYRPDDTRQVEIAVARTAEGN